MFKMKETNAKMGAFEFRLGRATELIEHMRARQDYMPGIDPFRPPYQLAKITAMCLHKGILIGLCEVRPRYNSIKIFVGPPFRRMGIGRRLLSMVCEEAKRQHMHFLIAIINPANPASTFLHASAGFKPIGMIYLESFPPIVMGLPLNVYGLAVTKICRLALRLAVPFSRFINFLAITILRRSDSEARLEWHRFPRRTSSNRVNGSPTNKRRPNMIEDANE